MPIKQVSECKCDRCARTWYIDQQEGHETLALPKVDIEYVSDVPEESCRVSYELLCSRCKKLVVSHINAIMLVKKPDAKGDGPDDPSPSS